MNEFINLFKKFMFNKEDITNNTTIMYSLAKSIFLNTNEINIKIFILESLMTLYPNDHELYYIMGNIYKNISKDKQLFWYKLSYNIKPDYTDNLFDLCHLLLEMGFQDHVFSLNKDNLFDKFMNEPRFLGIFVKCNLQNRKYDNNTLKDLLHLIKLNSTKHCITDSDKVDKWGNYLDVGHLLCILCDAKRAIHYSQKAFELSIKFNLGLDKKILSLQNMLCFSDYKYIDQEKMFNKCLEINNIIPDNPLFSFKNRTKKTKIRIGYLSSDFLMHPVSNFILPILKNHNTKLFEIFLFVNSENIIEDYKKLPLQIFFINKNSSREAAEMINKLKIDILFDLNGHTVNNRLEIFTYNPAPIQISYLGYPNTTGLKSIKYRITDGVADNFITKQRYSEELIRLPKCFLLYHPIHNYILKPNTTQKDRIILGSINKENKTNDKLLNVWKKILERCPNAVILIKLDSFGSDSLEERTQFYKGKLNIDNDRMIVLNKLPNGEYEKVFTMFDILLDTFPYSGTTTTCNCLYNSVPVVTLYHPDYHVNNVSSSLLLNCGFPELVAKTKDEYINIVVDLVNNHAKIDEYKKMIHNRFVKSMEPKPFMKSFERELKLVYEKSFINDCEKEAGTSYDKNKTVADADAIAVAVAKTVSSRICVRFRNRKKRFRRTHKRSGRCR